MAVRLGRCTLTGLWYVQECWYRYGRPFWKTKGVYFYRWEAEYHFTQLTL